MNNKYYLATVLLALGAFSPLYGVQNRGAGGGLWGGGGGGLSFCAFFAFFCLKNTPPPHNYSVNQNDIRLTGTVIDEAGIPVIGANILVKGTTNGTITDMDGKFTLINVPENAILVVSYIGYLDREIPVAGKSTLEIRLKEDTQKLDEVVVVG